MKTGFRGANHRLIGDAPFVGGCLKRILRGGCHRNWATHCMVSKRYEIVAETRDECVEFRLALSVTPKCA